MLHTTARICTRTKKCKHISPVIRSLHWLSVSKQIDFKMLTLTYKCPYLYNQAPTYLQELIQPYKPEQSVRSSNKLHLKVPKACLKSYGNCAFTKAAPSLWNNLPLHIRECDSTDAIKSVLKTFLFQWEPRTLSTIVSAYEQSIYFGILHYCK